MDQRQAPQTKPAAEQPGVKGKRFDFDRVPNRRDTDSRKWNQYDGDVLPMWIADMDFESPPAIAEALRERVQQGVFDYGRVEPLLADVICERLQGRYGWSVDPDELVFVPGVGPALHLMCWEFADAGDGVLVQTPIYPPFVSAPVHEKRRLVTSELQATVNGRDIRYRVDFAEFDSRLGAETRLFLLCNPHNPIGRAFDDDELTQMAESCLRNDMIICSDEIHCDLLLDGQRHRPLATLDPEIAQRCITLMAPSKTFNLAGLSFSFAVIQNPALRRRFAAAARGHLPRPNVLGSRAALAAYRDCEDWLEALLSYLAANRDHLLETAAGDLPNIRTTRPDATYLAWLDCRDAGIAGNPQRFFLENAKVALNDGADFGPGGEGFVRLNFACPHARLTEGLERMRKALEA